MYAIFIDVGGYGPIYLGNSRPNSWWSPVPTDPALVGLSLQYTAVRTSDPTVQFQSPTTTIGY